MNILPETLESTPNSEFEKKLSQIHDIADFEKAKTRISSLSKYLKEEMVGFVVPIRSKHIKCQWFEKGAEYLLRGSM